MNECGSATEKNVDEEKNDFVGRKRGNVNGWFDQTNDEA